MAAAMAANNTAAAAMSFAFPIRSFCSGDMVSAKYSMAEFTASAENTKPIAKITIIHSVVVMLKNQPAVTVQNAAHK